MKTAFSRRCIVTKQQASDWGFSGVMLRGSGMFWDLRLIENYDAYNLFDFSVPIGFYVIVLIVILYVLRKCAKVYI